MFLKNLILYSIHKLFRRINGIKIIQTLLNDSDSLLALCESGYEEAAEYQLFARCLSDQTVVENGKRRLRQSYTKSTRQCNVSFDRDNCVGCSYQDQCRPKIYKKVTRFITSKNASSRAKSQRYMQGTEFSNYTRLRNGVENVPSNIRKNYHLEKLPRGKQRGMRPIWHWHKELLINYS